MVAPEPGYGAEKLRQQRGDLPDAVTAMHAFLKRHPEVTWLRPVRGEILPRVPLPHKATWEDDDGTTVTVERYDLGPLVRYLLDRWEHEIVPEPGSVYSVGPRNMGNPAGLGNDLHHPVEARCKRCGKRVVRDSTRGAWRHEKRP